MDAETQTIFVEGAPTGGTYVFTFNYRKTPSIPYQASAAPVQALVDDKDDVIIDLIIMGEMIDLVRW